MNQRRSQRWIWPGLAAIASLLLVVRIALTWGVFNDMIDEPYHIGSGVAMWEAGRHVYGVQHPPLPRLVGALPLVLSGVRSGDERLGELTSDLAGFDVGHRVLVAGELPYWTTLLRARIPMLVFPLAAIVYVYLLGRYLGGPMVGGLAAAFFSTDPTLLGHSTWVATDVAAAAGFVAGTYHGVRFLGRPTLARAAGAGVAVGLALACKFTCALLLPVLGILWLLRGRRALATARRAVPLGTVGVLVALLTLWAVYFFDVGRLRDVNLPDMSVVERLPAWVQTLPLPMPTAVAGYLVLAQHNEQGHPAYLNGEVSMHGWWYYFLEALAIKSPLALLVALVLAATAVLLLRRPRRWRRALIVLLPCALFLIVSMNARLNIGIRHILPAIPFLYLISILWLVRSRLAPAAGGLILLAAVETIAVHPDYLAFFNVLVGGPRNGEKYLLDSNLDWGQDIARLRRWLEEHAGERVVSLRPFGNPRLREWQDAQLNLAPEGSPPTGMFAVSKNYLYDLYPCVTTDEQGRRRVEPSVAWLLRYEPVAEIGYSILVYDMDHLRPRPALRDR